MTYGITNYPVGATWQAVSDTGMVGKIWLERRDQGIEMWMWCVYWELDDSGYKSDWCTSYRMCKKEIPLWNHNYKPLRFKRVKE